MNIRTHIDSRIAALAAAALLLAALAVLGLQVGDAGAVAAKQLGRAQEKTKPTCPKENCQATGKVSGYQFSVDGERRLFKVPTDGRLVAWSIELAKPDKLSMNFFEENLTRKGYGGDPYARIGVLKRVDGKKPNAFKLVKQTPAVNLRNHLGDTPIFTLGKTMRIKKGQIVALSVPTWASNFVAGDSSSTQWRASRDSDKCDLSPGHEENREATKPQMKVGSVREYGCRYTGERLLYKAYYVPEK
jgi:hypothetical protein